VDIGGHVDPVHGEAVVEDDDTLRKDCSADC
jgi:hypothetical protein